MEVAMPYSSNADLPPGVRSKYSSRCQSVFRRVFNENHGSGEGKAFRIAHTAARRCMEAKAMDSLPQAEFKIVTGILKDFPGTDGRKRVKTVASSTLVDRQGDEMTEKAIRQMATTAVGKTVFLNHKYMVPEDVFGVVSEADVIQRGEVWDLDFTIEVEDENPRAERTHSSILRGVQLGTSVGAIVKDAWKEKDRVVIDDVELLEASIVGIPANPRSFVQYAVKAIHEAEEAEEEEVEEVAKATEPPDNATLAREEGEEAVGSPPPAESVDNDTQAEVSTETETEADAPEAQEGEEPAPDSPEGDAPVAKDISPTISMTNGTTSNTYRVDWNKVDDGDAVGDEARALLSMKQAEFTTLLKMVESTTNELVETKKALWDSQRAQAEAERERDEANANVELAKQFVQKLSELPVGRRASQRAVIVDFQEKFSGIYDPDFIKMLTSGDSNG